MLPEKASEVIERLNKSGFEAYAVGGCVRDMLRGGSPCDFDIATSALPAETERVFGDRRVTETGIAHGTVTVMWDGEPFEITTFRQDGEYKDLRRPESVAFTDRIEDDLARRDFTVNSMAMDRQGRIVDPYGGREDLEKGLIRCTGNAEKRFNEDALRILRALRFASVLDFEIEEKTSEAIHKNRRLIKKVSAQRVFSELKKILCGKAVGRILGEYPDVLCTIIPEMAPAVGFEHKSKYHIYDVYTHIIKSVETAEPEAVLRLALLFHDIGKPACSVETQGVRHFRGHPEKSAKIAEAVLRRLHADNGTIETVKVLCKYHDIVINPCEKSVRRLFLKMDYETVVLLCKVKKADSSAHNPAYSNRGREAEIIMQLAQKIHLENQCVRIKDLAVNGNDIKRLGFMGPEIGKVLESLLEAVVDERVLNEKSCLLNAAEEMKTEIFS